MLKLFNGKFLKLLEGVENIVANGEIARFEQFLLLSQCFQKSTDVEASECVYMWERVNGNIHYYIRHTYLAKRTNHTSVRTGRV